jgi:hypothetical protein
MGDRPLAGCFRDPAGFVFERDGVLLRRVRATFRPIYDQAVAEGLYARLFADRSLVHHEEAGEEAALAIVALGAVGLLWTGRLDRDGEEASATTS